MQRLNHFMTAPCIAPLYDYCIRHGELRRYSKGESFVAEGSLCRYFAFVQSGYFKYTVIDSNGDECITGLTFEGDLVGDYVCSFLLGKPSFTSIVAGSNAEVLQVPGAKIREHFASHPNLVAAASIVMLEEAYRRYLDVHTLTPLERYQRLKKRVPALDELVPVQELASYLSVSRRQFQRLRQISEQDYVS